MFAASIAAACGCPRSTACTTCVSQAQLSGANRAPHCAASPPQVSVREQALSLHLPHRRSRACASRRIAVRRASCAGSSFARVRFFASLMSTPLRSPAFAAASAGKSAHQNLGDGFSFPRRVFCARGLPVASRTRNEGWAERRKNVGCLRGTRSACSDTPGACEAPCVPCARDARLSALHRGDFGPGAALPSPDLRPDRSQRAPRTRVLVPGGRGPGPPETSGYQPRAAGRHSSLHLQEGALEDTPREQGCEFI